jgi:hypothetical protein
MKQGVPYGTMDHQGIIDFIFGYLAEGVGINERGLLECRGSKSRGKHNKPPRTPDRTKGIEFRGRERESRTKNNKKVINKKSTSF